MKALVLCVLCVGCASQDPAGTYRVTARALVTGELSCTDTSEPVPDPVTGESYVTIATHDGELAYLLSSAKTASVPSTNEWFAEVDSGWARADARVIPDEALVPYCWLSYQTLTIRLMGTTMHLDVRGRVDTDSEVANCTSTRALAQLREETSCLSANVWDTVRTH